MVWLAQHRLGGLGLAGKGRHTGRVDFPAAPFPWPGSLPPKPLARVLNYRPIFLAGQVC
jgi:hypothetical protein